MAKIRATERLDKTVTRFGVIEFDDKGVAEVSEEAVLALTELPGGLFVRVPEENKEIKLDIASQEDPVGEVTAEKPSRRNKRG